MEYYNRETEEIIKELNSSINGLSEEEAQERLKEDGKNTLPHKKKESLLNIFLHEFKDPMILLLIVAIIASLLSGETIDALAIILIVLVDVIMGTYQENKANNTAEALSNLVSVKTNVIRELDNEVRKEPYIALDGGEDGLYFYKKIIKESYQYLKFGGYLCLEIGFDQKIDIIDLIENEDKFEKTYSKKDLYDNDRIIVTRLS